ncbi:MAG: hypothetical protein GXP29_09265, partial [Planctomycetes bacterium]|nr:hypothetical protein [Planctomycetota bacterium]
MLPKTTRLLGKFRGMLLRSKAIAVTALLMCLVAPTSVRADGADDALRTSIGLFDRGAYSQAQTMLLSINKGDLDSSAGARRDDYIERSRVAMRMVDQAQTDLDDGLRAQKQGRNETAETLFNAVVANKYATRPQRSAAMKYKREIETARSGGVATGAPAVSSQPVSQYAMNDSSKGSYTGGGSGSNSDRARKLTREGYDALQAGNNSEAIRLFNQALQMVPGYPKAVEGVRQAKGHDRVESASSSLLNRIRQQNSIRWSRAEETYRGYEKEIHDAILSGNVDLARELLLSARQVVEGAKQYADPLIKYESLISEIEALENNIGAEVERSDASRAKSQRDEIQRTERDSRRRTSERRGRRI